MCEENGPFLVISSLVNPSHPHYNHTTVTAWMQKGGRGPREGKEEAIQYCIFSKRVQKSCLDSSWLLSLVRDQAGLVETDTTTSFASLAILLVRLSWAGEVFCLSPPSFYQRMGRGQSQYTKRNVM